MTEKDNNDDELLTKLEVIGNGGWFIWKVFLLCTIPSILNGLNLTSYVYLAEVPQHWCSVPELTNANWTDEQIRNLSSPGGRDDSSCWFYDYDYAKLSAMSYEEAMIYVNGTDRPKTKPCSGYSYAKGISSIVVEYDLVCHRMPLKSTIQVALSLGKFLGAFVFGMISDKYGRRLSFFLGCLFYIVSGPLVSFAVDYSMIIAGRIGLGAAGSAIYHSAYVILIEIIGKVHRAAFSNLYNMSYPIGQMIVPLIAYYVNDWRNLQLCISIPAVFTLLFCWLIPESPRWLISMGKRDRAEKFINKVYSDELRVRWDAKARATDSESVIQKPREEREESVKIIPMKKSQSSRDGDEILGKASSSLLQNLWLKISSGLKQFVELIKYPELRNRLFIVLFSWCVCSLSYYALALNVDNFHTDRYIYGFLTGLVEMPSYIIALPLLKFLGRRSTCIIFYYTGGLALVAILLIPRTPELNYIILTVALIGRMCSSAVFAVVILHSTELFPTIVRNTAIGLGSTAAHVGSMSAPFLVDLLGSYAWFIPSTVCGLATLVAGTFVFLLPETKNKQLPDTIQDILNASKENKIGFHQICSR